MIKAHKIRLNPTPEQEVYLRKACSTARFVHKWSLAAWKRHKAEDPGQEYGVMAIKKDFNAIKRMQFPWVLNVGKDVAEGAFTNLAVAFKNYSAAKTANVRSQRLG
jgi:putative transposase